MQHTDTLNIATGLSARSKVWKNKKTTWEKLVEKLREVNRTGETSKTYHAANKADRSKIKDSGGYVGGYLRGGRRKPQNVVHRSLLTLDLDFAHLDIWEDFIMLYDNAAVLHSTHSHTEKNPKYRLIMPLSRETTPDEYVAVARRIAGDIGIDYFDNTGFQPYRLMFWPSCSKDAEYSFYSQEGDFIDVDEVLATYLDWTDSSLYPVSGQYIDAVTKLKDKQEDPLEKRGLIGAFCRTYTISEAIANFLGEQYTEVGEERYTYSGGSTAGGLVTYDEKFAYSHHGTDPIRGQLCNAFDLVRVHLYGHLDEDSTGSGSKLPSFKKMEEFCRQDSGVKLTIAEENLHSARYDFPDDWEEPETEEEENLDWVQELEIDHRGNYLSNSVNLNLILKNDARLKDAFRYNTFDQKRYIWRSMPWRKVPRPEPIRNVDYSGIRNYVETIYGISATSKIDDALALDFEKHSFHPVKDYLEVAEWDGVERIDTLLSEYFGADDNAYTRAAMRKMLAGAVARIFEPGVKFDLVLTLIGNQGDGKSTFINRLGGNWFSDSFSTLHGKDAFEQLQGAWLIEMAELSGLRKAEVETIKHFITKQEDVYRPAYARSVETFPRQCVFFATTNKRTFLTDATGNRRFMPIDVYMPKAKKDPRTISPGEVEQVWAEAVQLYRRGELLYLTGEAEKIAKKEQYAHREQDERVGLIMKYLDTKLPKNWKSLDVLQRSMFMNDEEDTETGTIERDYVCVAEIWCECLGKPKEDLDRYRSRELNEIMRGLEEWEQGKNTKIFTHYGKQRYYQRKLF